MDNVDGTIDWSQIAETTAAPGITARLSGGAQLSAAMFVLEAGAKVPAHSHSSEEFGFVVHGALEVTWAGTRNLVRAGEAFIIPGDVEHEAIALDDGCHLLECYAPPRTPIAPA